MMNIMNRLFRVKGVAGIETVIQVLNEAEDGYDVHIRSVSDYIVRESDEYVSRDLLESCLRTGYLSEVRSESVIA